MPYLHQIEEAPEGDQVKHDVHRRVANRQQQQARVGQQANGMPHLPTRSVDAPNLLSRLGKFGGGDRAVFARGISGLDPPKYHQQQHRKSRDDKGQPPAYDHHQRRDDRRRGGRSNAKTCSAPALRPRPVSGWEPAL